MFADTLNNAILLHIGVICMMVMELESLILID